MTDLASPTRDVGPAEEADGSHQRDLSDHVAADTTKNDDQATELGTSPDSPTDLEEIDLSRSETKRPAIDIDAPKPNQEAWIRVVPPAPAYPNIFDFVPVPELPSQTVNAELSVPTLGEAPSHDQDMPPQLSAHDLPVPGTPGPHNLRSQDPILSLELAEDQDAEKTYAVPSDLPDFGWFDVAELGIFLAYMTMLLRRNISPRFLVLDEDASPNAKRFRPIGSSACVILAHAGIAFNQCTDELIIRQSAPVQSRKNKDHGIKQKRQRSRSSFIQRHNIASPTKYLVRPVIPSPPKLKLRQNTKDTASKETVKPPNSANPGSPGQNPTTTDPTLIEMAQSAMLASPGQSPPTKSGPQSPPKLNAFLDRSRSKKTKRVSFTPNKIGNAGAIALFRALRVNTCLRSLVLENAGIDDRAMYALLAMLRVNCSLTSLSLRGNSIGPLGVEIIAEALSDCADSSLLALDLGRNRIQDAGVDALCRVLTDNETLLWLDISWNQVSSLVTLRLLHALRLNFVIREVAVYGKDIDEDQYCQNLEAKYAKDLGAALRQLNPSFASIRLSGPNARLPVDRMKDSRWLALEGRELVELDALVISGLVPLNDHLMTLDISNNPGIERWGILEVLKSIKHCTALKHVNISNTGLYEEVGELIGDLVATNDTLKTIVVHEQELQVQQLRGQEPVEVLSFEIPQKHHFDRWILNKCLRLNRPTQELNGLRLPVPASVVTGRPKKVSVNYSGRKLDVFEIVFLAKKLLHHLHIGRVSINGCGINGYAGAALADGIRNHASLETLEMENNLIGVHGGRAMIECIEFNRSLTWLNLSWNKIGNDGAAGLEAALRANTCLRRLDLRGNDLGVVAIKAISLGLKGNACLEELYLRWNQICPTGGEALALALTTNKFLRILDIEHHIMGARGGQAFATMLLKNTRLEELNMKGDDRISDGDASGIGPEAAQAIAQALTDRNRTLRHLNIAQNQIGRDGIVWFANMIKRNPVLEVLDVSISSMDGKIADRFFQCLTMNRTIVKLNLAHNRISNDGMMACIRALELNRVLQDLNVAHNGITEEPLAYFLTRLGDRKVTITLRWLCLIGNTMTDATRGAYRALPPEKLVVELVEPRHAHD